MHSQRREVYRTLGCVLNLSCWCLVCVECVLNQSHVGVSLLRRC